MSARRSILLLGVLLVVAWTFLLLTPRADADEVGPSSAPKYAFVDATVGTTGATVIGNVPSRRFRVWSYTVQNKDAGNNVHVRFKSDNCASGPAHTPEWKLASNSTMEQPATSPYPQFETFTDANLVVCASASRPIAVMVTYTEFDPAATTYDTTGHPVDVENAVLTTRDNHTSSDRLHVDLDASDVGSGGGSGGAVTVEAFEADALTFVTSVKELVAFAGGVVVFLLTGILILGHFPKKRLPL